MKRLASGVLLTVTLVAGIAGADETRPAAPAGETIRQVAKPGRAAADLTPLPFDVATTARYRRTALALAQAVGTDDSVAFRALHTDAGWAQTDEWWRSMLATHRRQFGGVARIVGPLRGVIRSGRADLGVPRDGAAILVRFEKHMGAAMSFTLDAEGKIVKSRLWVQELLADADIQGAEVLWGAKQQGPRR